MSFHFKYLTLKYNHAHIPTYTTASVDKMSVDKMSVDEITVDKVHID
jgi:hypothetical protein